LLVRLSARGVDCCRPRRRPKPRGLRCLWKPSSARPVLARRKARPSGRCATTACGLPIRPVLEHGPRSLTCVRVDGWLRGWKETFEGSLVIAALHFTEGFQYSRLVLSAVGKVPGHYYFSSARLQPLKHQYPIQKSPSLFLHCSPSISLGRRRFTLSLLIPSGKRSSFIW